MSDSTKLNSSTANTVLRTQRSFWPELSSLLTASSTVFLCVWTETKAGVRTVSNTVEPLNNRHVGSKHFALLKEFVLPSEVEIGKLNIWELKL